MVGNNVIKKTFYILLSTPFTMAGPRYSPERGENGCDPPSPYDHDGHINDGLGRGLQRQTGERGMDRRVPFLAHKLPGTQSCLPGFDVFSPRSRGASYHSQNGQYGGSVPHKPHPGQACMPSSVSQIWNLFGKVEVDLFASQDSSQCPLWFFLSFPASLGIDAFAHPWPNVSLYAFPPIKLIPAVLCRVKVSGARLLLIAPFWPSQTWFSELTPLLYRPPWEIPIRRDLLSQLQGRIWHPQPELWKLWVWPIQGQGPWWIIYLSRFRRPSPVPEPPLLGSRTLPSGASLSPGVWLVQSTQLTALLVQCWSFCKRGWQQGRLLPTLWVYVVAIAAWRELDEIPWGRHRVVSAFMRGVRWLRPVRPTAVPSWDLSVVLEGLVTAPFEPLESAPERILTLKVNLLLALTSLKRVGDLQALSVSEMCMDFARGLVKVTLRPRPGYIPEHPHRFALRWSHFTLSILLPLLRVRMRSFTCSARYGHWSCMWIAPRFGENPPSCWCVLVLAAVGLPHRNIEDSPLRTPLSGFTTLHLIRLQVLRSCLFEPAVCWLVHYWTR